MVFSALNERLSVRSPVEGAWCPMHSTCPATLTIDHTERQPVPPCGTAPEPSPRSSLCQSETCRGRPPLRWRHSCTRSVGFMKKEQQRQYQRQLSRLDRKGCRMEAWPLTSFRTKSMALHEALMIPCSLYLPVFLASLIWASCIMAKEVEVTESFAKRFGLRKSILLLGVSSPGPT